MASKGSFFTENGYSPTQSGQFQVYDDDLQAIADLSTASGFLRKTGAGTWALLTDTEVTARLIEFAGSSKGLVPISTGNTTQFLRGDGAWAVPATLSHTHAQSEITNLVTDLAGKAALAHTHAQADITNLVSDLAACVKNNVSTNLTVGYTSTGYSAGTKSSGTFTPDPANGTLQYATNGGAHTLAPPSTGSGNAVSMVIQYTNNGTAGAITTSGFTKVSGSFTTTNGDKFMCFITVINGFSFLNIVAMQ